jgi:hypothetical protein
LGNSIKLAGRDFVNELGQDAEDSKQYLKDTRTTPLTTAKGVEAAVNSLAFSPGVAQGRNAVKGATKQAFKNTAKNTLK